MRGWEWLGLAAIVALFAGIAVAVLRANRRTGAGGGFSLGMGPAQSSAWGAVLTVGGGLLWLLLPSSTRYLGGIVALAGLVILAFGIVSLGRRSDDAPPPSPKPPAWYPDPSGHGQRYWDGREWTEHTAP